MIIENWAEELQYEDEELSPYAGRAIIGVLLLANF